MVFSSFTFLFLFLPGVLFVYYLCPGKFRNTFLLCASYFFYAWGAPRVILVLLITSCIDYGLSWGIYKARRPRRSGILLGVAVTLNVALLVYYKYSNFFMAELNGTLQSFGLRGWHWEHIALPIGISFFTFQKISYLVDVYRGRVGPAPSLIHYALYVALFPQLIAGPIVRYHDIADQLSKRVHRLDNLFYGMFRFCIGLGKKVLIADVLGAVADNVFSLAPGQLSASYAWLGIACYSFQIYFDFSGYSDMAIGLGRMFGFRFLENFNMPYIAQNFSEFWRRWHISLSNWMREYLYIPLGGNRGSRMRTYLNLWIVFMLSGLWHGASWSFVAWGAYHGLFLVIDKLFWIRISRAFHRYTNVLLTFLLVVIGWVFFRSETLTEAIFFLRCMFGAGLVASGESLVLEGNIIHSRAWATLFVAAVMSFAPLLYCNSQWWAWVLRKRRGISQQVLQGGAALLSLLLSLFALAGSGYTPFLYFRF